MPLSPDDIREILAALDREPAWKLYLLETCEDAFVAWLQDVLPIVFERICESAEHAFWRIIG